MTVYFQGTEIQDFLLADVNLAQISHSTSSSKRKTANTRCSILVEESSGAAGLRLQTPVLTMPSEFWTHFVHSFATTAIGADGIFANWRKGSTARLGLRKKNGTLDTFELLKWNGSSWDVLDTSGAVSGFTTNLYDWDIRIITGNPGTVVVYLDGSPIIGSNAYDLSWGDDNLINRFRISSVGDTQISYTSYVSEIILADWNTIGSKLVSRIPDADGTYQEFAGGSYTQVNELNPASTFLVSDAADERVTMSLTDFPALAGEEERIESVQITVNIQRDVDGPQNFNAMVRIDGTDYHSDDQSLTVAADNRYEIFEFSPDTDTYWTPDELNASEFGIRSRT